MTPLHLALKCILDDLRAIRSRWKCRQDALRTDCDSLGQTTSGGSQGCVATLNTSVKCSCIFHPYTTSGPHHYSFPPASTASSFLLSVSIFLCVPGYYHVWQNEMRTLYCDDACRVSHCDCNVLRFLFCFLKANSYHLQKNGYNVNVWITTLYQWNPKRFSLFSLRLFPLRLEDYTQIPP